MTGPDSPMRLSALDQSPIPEGQTTADALRNSVALACAVEAFGYERFWVAEHHATAMLAGTSPEILIAHIGAATTRMRVGSGGVMLPHYSPLKVAETFRMLNAFHPGRIDLAVGRAAGTDPLTAFALQRDRRTRAPDDFPEQLAELLAYIRDGFPSGHRFAALAASMRDRTAISPWLLGSSPQSAIWAAELGLPYAFADFINPAGAAIAREYRARFVPSPGQPAPYVIAAVWALAAETDQDAERLAASSRAGFARFLSGEPGPIPSTETALEFLRQHPDALTLAGHRRRSIVGHPARVRAALDAVAADYAADELMIVTITHEHQARVRSYELLANEFGLNQEA